MDVCGRNKFKFANLVVCTVRGDWTTGEILTANEFYALGPQKQIKKMTMGGAIRQYFSKSQWYRTLRIFRSSVDYRNSSACVEFNIVYSRSSMNFMSKSDGFIFKKDSGSYNTAFLLNPVVLYSFL